MRAAATLLAVIVFGVTPSLAEKAKFGPMQTHTGTCEPSAAIAVPEDGLDRFVVANDEKNTLFAYRPAGGAKEDVANGDLNKFLKVDDTKNNNEVDFEGAAWLNGKVYWIGSHSRSKNGHNRPARRQLFATDIALEGGKPVVKGKSKRSFNGLLEAIEALDPTLEPSIQSKEPTLVKLAPDNGGFNIEGLTAMADGKSLLLALRSPVIDKQALLIPLQNPEGVVEKDEKPLLGSPLKVALVGKGIRSIEYSHAAKTYFIIAGPSGGGGGSFDLVRWSGDKPEVEPVDDFAAGLAALDTSNPPRPFRPEAMAVDASGKKLHLFSDDGDDCDKVPSTFRSVTVTIE